jgi:hypothetical protein
LIEKLKKENDKKSHSTSEQNNNDSTDEIEFDLKELNVNRKKSLFL